MAPTDTQHQISPQDLRSLMTGAEGADLERVIENGAQVAMRVVGVRSGSIAERLGARNGDLVVSINDAPLHSIPAAYSAANAAISTGRIVIRGSRDGEPYTTTITLANRT